MALNTHNEYTTGTWSGLRPNQCLLVFLNSVGLSENISYFIGAVVVMIVW